MIFHTAINVKLGNIDVSVLAFCILDRFYSGNMGTNVPLTGVSILKILGQAINITLGLWGKLDSLMN
jgi:hypothetical protein